VWPGFNDLATQRPDLAAQAHGWDPTTVTVGSGQRRDWICRIGHVWTAAVVSRSRTGCPVCAGNTVLVGFNDLASNYPPVASEADGWDPTKYLPGSQHRVNWKCERGHRWEATIANRTFGRGCPSCAKGGYDPNKPGYMYLMERTGEQQIGITNVPDDRIGHHRDNGWSLLELTPAADGHAVRTLETLLRRWLKAEIGVLPGTAENWSTADLEIRSLRALMGLAAINPEGRLGRLPSTSAPTGRCSTPRPST